MKTLLTAWAFAIGLVLGGCALVQPTGLPVSQTLSPAAQEAQRAINEANVILAAAANVTAQNVADGILTKPEGQAYVAKLKEYAGKVDAAQKLLDSGDVLNAKTQAEVLSRLIVALHKEVAARSRK